MFKQNNKILVADPMIDIPAWRQSQVNIFMQRKRQFKYPFMWLVSAGETDFAHRKSTTFFALSGSEPWWTANINRLYPTSLTLQERYVVGTALNMRVHTPASPCQGHSGDHLAPNYNRFHSFAMPVMKSSSQAWKKCWSGIPRPL